MINNVISTGMYTGSGCTGRGRDDVDDMVDVVTVVVAVLKTWVTLSGFTSPFSRDTKTLK